MHSKLFLLSLLLLLSCGGTKTIVIPEAKPLPDWVNNPHINHPKSIYLVAVGVAQSKFEAESKAYEGIARVFGVDVNSTETLTTHVSETGVGANSELSKTAKMVNQLNVKTGQKVLNTQIEASYLDTRSGNYYVLATLHKVRTSEVYVAQVNENKSQIDKWLTLFEQENDQITKLGYLTKAKSLIDLTNYLKQPLKVLGYYGTDIDLTNTDKKVEEKRQALLASTKVYVHSNEGTASVNDAILKSITNQGLRVTSNEQEAYISVFYTFSAKEINIGQKNGTKFALWDLSIDIKRSKNNASFGVYSKTNRAGQMNIDAAKKRAIYEATKDISTHFGSFFTNKVFN